MIRIVNSLEKRREKVLFQNLCWLEMQSYSKKIFFLYMSHLLKGGNVGQNIKKNQFLPPRDTMCVQIITGFKAEVCSWTSLSVLVTRNW